MNIKVEIHTGPLARDLAMPEIPGSGAILKFEGLVRPVEGGKPIDGLSYEAYQPMAGKQLEELARTTVAKHEGVRAIHVYHSTGFVPNNENSFTLLIAAAHRKEALAAADYFIDEMKQHVPIWKSAVYSK